MSDRVRRLREALGRMLKTVDGPRVSAEDARTQFSIFAFLLALAILFHESRLGERELLSGDTAVSLAAIAVLLRPSSLPRFLAMLALQLAAVALELPLVVNHWILVGLTVLGLSAGLILAALQRQPWLSDTGEVYRRIAPPVRIVVIFVYAFAFLSKLNTDFFDPVLSCASAMSGDLLASSPVSFHAGWQDSPAIAGTLLIEGLLPIGLFLRRTRVPIVIGGSIFHTVLALAGHVPFSGFAFAFYFLFLPDDMPRRLRRLVAETPALQAIGARARDFARWPAAFPTLAVAWIVIVLGRSYGPDFFATTVSRGGLLVFLPYVAALGITLVLCLRQGGPLAYQPGTLRLAHPIWALAPMLVALNAITPYIGLKTQDAFTMYSNLQTEEGRWNHLLLPESIRVFNLQDNLVSIVSSSDPILAEAARNGTELTRHDFRNYVSARPEISVSYRLDGRLVSIARVGDDPEASNRPGLVARRLLLFRDVPDSDQNACRDRGRAGAQNGS